jgi:hypothetical protein
VLISDSIYNMGGRNWKGQGKIHIGLGSISVSSS